MSRLKFERWLIETGVRGSSHGDAAQIGRPKASLHDEEDDVSDQINAADYGFSPAVASGEFLFCSGQIGMDADGNVPVDPARQFSLAFQALRGLLEQHGCEVDDIVDLTTFHVSYPQHMDVFMEQKAAFQGRARPAWTAIGVASLGHPESLVEIKAVARIRHP